MVLFIVPYSHLDRAIKLVNITQCYARYRILGNWQPMADIEEVASPIDWLQPLSVSPLVGAPPIDARGRAEVFQRHFTSGRCSSWRSMRLRLFYYVAHAHWRIKEPWTSSPPGAQKGCMLVAALTAPAHTRAYTMTPLYRRHLVDGI